MARNLQPRKQRGEHDIEAFNYPFQSTGEGERRGIPHLVSPPTGNFPGNIKRWIWSSAGQPDGDSWVCLVELKQEKGYEGQRYLYYTAWCDYTGFDCQGGGHTIVAERLEDLVEYALENADYLRYMKETEPADAW
jgi:hypothetical protein